jgi:hypothetical protein
MIKKVRGLGADEQQAVSRTRYSAAIAENIKVDYDLLFLIVILMITLAADAYQSPCSYTS